MRGPILSVLPLAACLGAAPLAALLASPALAGDAGPDRESLRKAWHRCVRQEFSGQPASVEKQAAQRAALAACKPSEDAYVAAELAARQAESGTDRPGLTSRARAWISTVGSSVAAYVVDPIASWFGGSGR